MKQQMDKSMVYISQTQTLIGTQQRVLEDTQTGECIVVNQITKRVYGTKGFWKCYLENFLSVLDIIESKQLAVFIHIVKNINQSSNQFNGTYKKIAKAVHVSEPTIAQIMNKLQEKNFIKKVQNGVWMVNPDILMKGNDYKRHNLLEKYNNPQGIDTPAINVDATDET